ncbi:MAG: extracellular solute-binding protein [Clostridia bacterium]
MKRMTMLLLVLVMIVTSISGYAAEENTLPICTDGSVKIQFYMGMETGSEQAMQTYDEHPAIIELEKRTGVDITFMHPPTNDDGTFFTTTVASGVWPDAWITTNFQTYYPGGISGAIQDATLYDINELIEKYGWYYQQESAKWEPAVVKNMKDDDGYWRFGAANQRIPVLGMQHAGAVIRTDWLKKYNLEVPKTVDAFINVLRTFKENGAAIPLAMSKFTSNSYYDCAFLSGAFGVMPYGYQFKEDGKTVTASYLEEGYRDYLAFLHGLYEEGLIDRDFVNRVNNDAQKLIYSGDAGVIFAGNWTTREILKLGKVAFPEFDIQGISSLRKEDPEAQFHFCYPIINGSSTQAWAISAKSKFPVETFKVLDYLYSHEGIELMVFGCNEAPAYDNHEKMEVIHTTLPDGTRQFSDYINNNPKLAYNQIRYIYTIQALSSEYSSDMEYQQYNAPINAQCWEAWTYKVDNLQRLPNARSYTAEESQELVPKNNDVQTYIYDIIYKIICGDEPIENWPTHVQRLHDLGIDQSIAIEQASCDRYFAR